MNHTVKPIFFAAIISAIIAFSGKERLLGRWESQPSPSGNISGIVFKADNTYMAYTNRTPFTSGVYSLRDSLLTIRESACEQPGTYKTIFYASGDSLRLQPVTDSCTERAKGISRLVFGRVN
jgi:hypothetical protein